MSKILVTGASGHLGRKTLQHLLKRRPAGDLVGLARDPEQAADLARSLGSSNGAGSGLVIVILWLIVGTSLVLKWLWNYAVSIPGLFLRFFMRPSVACPCCGRVIHARINDYATWPASCPRCQQRLAPLEPIYVIT